MQVRALDEAMPYRYRASTSARTARLQVMQVRAGTKKCTPLTEGGVPLPLSLIQYIFLFHYLHTCKPLLT